MSEMTQVPYEGGGGRGGSASDRELCPHHRARRSRTATSCALTVNSKTSCDASGEYVDVLRLAKRLDAGGVVK
jgi:hypothetical protein